MERLAALIAELRPRRCFRVVVTLYRSLLPAPGRRGWVVDTAPRSGVAVLGGGYRSRLRGGGVGWGDGADGIRTHDPLRARQVLSQLSYRPQVQQL